MVARTMTQELMRDCSTCAGQRVFEAPACADGHDADCPELACVECGTAVFVGIFDFGVPVAPLAAPDIAAAA